MKKVMVALVMALLAGQVMAECSINPPSCPLGGGSQPVCISGVWQCM